MDPDLKKRARVAAFGRGIEISDAVEEGLKLWLRAVEIGAVPSEECQLAAGLSKPQRKLLEKYAHVLRTEKDDETSAKFAMIIRGALGLLKEP